MFGEAMGISERTCGSLLIVLRAWMVGEEIDRETRSRAGVGQDYHGYVRPTSFLYRCRSGRKGSNEFVSDRHVGQLESVMAGFSNEISNELRISYYHGYAQLHFY